MKYNEARYGTNLCGSTVCTTVWALLRDAANQWVLDQLAAGQTMAQVQATLASYDVEDRYDYDEDGNFNEPDHYIDHFQLLHAGADEAVGGGAEGTNAIWSHRWFAWQGTGTADGKGPAGNQAGGFEIGAGVGHPTGMWVGDYLMIPENSGVGVIAHETGHDYGLPDEYDRSYGGDSSAGFWTIMASGSYGGDGTNGIGNRPVDFNAWDKWQLGWLDPQVVDPLKDGKTEMKLGPAEANTKQAQAAFVKLPSVTKTIKVGVPPSATHAWYSGMGDDYKAVLSRTVAVPAGHDHVRVQDVVRGRARLRLRVRAGVDRRRPDVGHAAHVHRHVGRIRRPRVRQRRDRCRRAGVDLRLGESVGVRGQDDHAPLQVHRRLRCHGSRCRARRSLDHERRHDAPQRQRRGRRRQRLDDVQLPQDGERRRRARRSTARTWSRTGSTRATTRGSRRARTTSASTDKADKQKWVEHYRTRTAS